MTTTKIRRRGRRLGIGALAALMVASLTSCDPLFDAVVTTPGMYPVFQTGVTDYVNRCNPSRPTDVKVTAPPGAVVSIAGRPLRRGTFTERVTQRHNERFTIVITLKGTTTVHHVRCLPAGFPSWSAERTDGEVPRSEFYVTTMVEGFQPNRPVIFDTNGVPIWWSEKTPHFLTTPLRNGNLAVLGYAGGMVERRLDGTIARTLDTVGATADFHDVLLLESGNYVMVTGDFRPCDLTAWGKGAAEECLFHEVQELTPEGAVVWDWRPEEHIPITETPPRWRNTLDPLNGAFDPWHWNAIEWTGDGFLLSFRHQDAIYKVDHESREIVWKLGGRRRAESLDVVGDRIFALGSSISGQHDVRLLPDGTVSLFDNRSFSTADSRPRSVRYRIDEGAGTATLVEQVRDPIAPRSDCCGSTRVLSNGNYVTGYGGTPWMTENRPDGTRVFRLSSTFFYRAIPVEPGVLDRDELRAGMDAQFDGDALAPGRRAPTVPTDPDVVGDLRTRLGTDI